MNTNDYKYPKEQIIIVGAGIAGLSLAIQLTENNIPCLLLEARDHFSGATSGVRISADGVRVLKKMGIQDIGEPTEKLIMYFGKSKISFKVKKKPEDSPAIIVTRRAIFEKLRQRVDEMNIQILYDFTLDRVLEHENGIIAISTDGTPIEGKYLVGADGVGSKVRHLLNPEDKTHKRYAGYLGIGLIYPSNQKIEMSLFNNVNGNIGLGSIGKVDPKDDYTNNFLWTHIHMDEKTAKNINDQEVYQLLLAKSKHWPHELQQILKTCQTSKNTVMYHQAVYNGDIPAKWYNDRLFLIGDAAHPYGPGGQGMSLAMQDAEALCSLLTQELTDEGKENFQQTRMAIAKSKGESSEERNKPENQISSKWKLMFKAVFMRIYQFINAGKIEL